MATDSVPPLDSRSRQVALTQLRRLGVQVFVTRRGGVKGRVLIAADSFPGREAAELDDEQAFQVLDSQSLQFVDPSPLSALGPIEFAGARDHDDLEARIRGVWQTWWGRQEAVLERARTLAPDAAFHVNPWRIEGEATHGFERVRLLFSADARRAVVTAVAGRPVSVPPAEPRVILPVNSPPREDELDELMGRAIDQAKRYAPESDDLAEADWLSYDLGTSDLTGRGESS